MIHISTPQKMYVDRGNAKNANVFFETTTTKCNYPEEIHFFYPAMTY